MTQQPTKGKHHKLVKKSCASGPCGQTCPETKVKKKSSRYHDESSIDENLRQDEGEKGEEGEGLL